MKKLFALTAAAGLAIAVAPAHAAPDAEAGRKMAEQVCAACHGMDGNSENVAYPRILYARKNQV